MDNIKYGSELVISEEEEILPYFLEDYENQVQVPAAFSIGDGVHGLLCSLQSAEHAIRNFFPEIELPDTLLLPSWEYNHLKSWGVGVWSVKEGGTSILDYYQRRSPHIKNIYPLRTVPRINGLRAACFYNRKNSPIDQRSILWLVGI